MAETFPPPMIEPSTGFMAMRPVLGLTAYLAEPELWAREGARKVLDAFLRSPKAENLHWFTTSAISEWRPIGDGGVQDLRRELTSEMLSKSGSTVPPTARLSSTTARSDRLLTSLT